MSNSINILQFCAPNEYKKSMIYMNLTNNLNIIISNNNSGIMLANIKLKYDKYNLVVTINKHIYKKYISNNKIIVHTNKKYIAILISCLQKCVRRQLITNSTHIAQELINIGQTTKLLRRLCIIILEDCILIKYYPFIVYLMVLSSKNICFTDYVNNIIISLVEHICQINFLDSYNSKAELTNIDIKTILEHKHKTLLIALLIRKNYGGMSCDLLMIDQYVNIWMNRKKSIIIDAEFNRNLIINEYNLVFDKKYLIKECIDFHCCPNIFKSLNTHIPDVDLKMAIWYNRSSINKRTILDLDKFIFYNNKQKQYYNIYNIIKNKLNNISKQTLMLL
jgi:hypothetical protein